MVDVDFLAVEFNHRRAYALIDYKHERAFDLRLDSANVAAMRDLGTRAGVAAAVVRYWPGVWVFQPYPLNDVARSCFRTGELLSEREYVERLYAMRNSQIDAETLSGLLTTGVEEVSYRLSVAPKKESAEVIGR